MDEKEQALELARKAYIVLSKAGISEEFAPLVMLVVQANNGTFFGSFGSDSGCFIEFQRCENTFTPVKLVFGMRRYKQPIWLRVTNAFREVWAILRGHDSEHEIHLKPADITRLKDLLRVLK